MHPALRGVFRYSTLCQYTDKARSMSALCCDAVLLAVLVLSRSVLLFGRYICVNVFAADESVEEYVCEG